VLPQEQGTASTTLAVWGLALLLGLLSFPAAADSCIWYADDDTIRQLQTSSNQVIRVVPLKHPHRLVMNAADCGVWTLDKHGRRLLRYSAEGILELEFRLRDLDRKLHEVERLQLDPFDGSLWIAHDQRVFHVSSAGELLGRFSAPGDVRRLRVALDQDLWVLGKRDLWRFDAQGTLLASYRLGRHLARNARYVALDNLGGLIWLADDEELAQLKLSNPEDPPLRIRLRRDIAGLALDPLTGNVWVAQKQALLAYSRAGVLTHTVDLNALQLRKPEKLAFDPVSRSLWVGLERAIARFTDTGQFVIKLAARDGDEALGVPAFKVEPTLTLVRPPENALTNNARPPFLLGYGVQCNGAHCLFSNDHLAAYKLSATLNGQPVGSAFVFNPETAEAAFTPSARLPEGTNTFSAQVKDGFDHQSNTVTNTFAVDTIAPRFVTLSPADGSVFQSPQVTIQGSVDDPTAQVVLEQFADLYGVGANPQRRNFSYQLTLKPGANPVRLMAIDSAGNVSSELLRLTLLPAGLSISFTQPTDGASVADERILVSGAVAGPPNTGVSVNGVVASIVGDRFYALVPLVTGANTITATATAFDGMTKMATVSVSRNGTAALQVSASPATGIAPLTTRFNITPSSGVTVMKFEADVDGDGTSDVSANTAPATLDHAFATPGVFLARFMLTEAGGLVHTQTVPIIVQDGAQVDQVFQTLWGRFTEALARSDLLLAQQHMNEEAKRKYAPVFTALASRMPQIVSSFSPLLRGEHLEGVAEYAIVREIAGSKRLFFIYFVQSENGVWLLDSM